MFDGTLEKRIFFIVVSLVGISALMFGRVTNSVPVQMIGLACVLAPELAGYGIVEWVRKLR